MFLQPYASAAHAANDLGGKCCAIAAALHCCHPETRWTVDVTIGTHLKTWRHRRGMSQLRLALEANVSARHIAFIETGRANPTRAMVLRLSEALSVPRPERNTLLEAAGYSAAYTTRRLDADEMSSIRAAVAWTLDRHDPYPAFALDRHWRLVKLNRSAACLLAAMGVREGDSLLDALLATDGLRQAIENWPDVGQHMLARLRTESRHVGGDAVLDAAADRLARDIDMRHAPTGILPAVVTTRLRTPAGPLALFSTIAQFGTAEDIALAEYKIELLFPADDATRQALAAMATVDR